MPRIFTAEMRRKIAEEVRARWTDPAYREKMTEVARQLTPARKKHLEKLHADPVLKDKRMTTLRSTMGRKRGFDLPPELEDDYRTIRRKLGSATEAGRVMGLIK